MSRSPFPLIFCGLLSGFLAGCRAPVWPEVKQGIRSEFPRVKHISVDDLDAWLTSEEPPPLLIDVREEAEFRVSHLPGAVRVDPGDDPPALPEGIEKETPIVAYCSVGYRSSALVRSLTQLGYTDVSNLEGSIFEWANRGLPVVRDGRKVRQVHPYDERWGRLLAAELRAYTAD